jgi:two-component system, LytTR family, sensor kinase
MESFQARLRMYWFAQLFGWSAYVLVIFLVLYLENKVTWQGIALLALFALTGIVVSHGMRWLFNRFDFFSYKPAPLIPRLLGIAFLAAIVFQLIYSLLASFFDREVVPESVLEFLIEVLLIMFLFSIWNIIYFFNHFIRKSRLEEIKNLQLADSQKEIELQNLRTQLNPHFLFNALNSIRALIDLDPSLAKESVTKLSAILRNSLLFGRKEQVTLDEECQFVQNYLDLEKIRFEERLRVYWEVDDQLRHELIPPLILQMLVENAIKHGISNLIEGGEVLIRAKREDDALILEVENTGKLKTEVDTGVGIMNARRRLALLYGDDAHFFLSQKGQRVIARIKIKKQRT